MMIATLTLNPSLDKTVVLENLVFEDVNRAKQIYTDPGGKGINVSRVISRFGRETVALGFLGGLTGDDVLTLLKIEFVGNPVRNQFSSRNLVSADYFLPDHLL